MLKVPVLHSEKFKINEEVDSFLSEKVSKKVLHFSLSYIRTMLQFCVLDLIFFLTE